MKNILIFLSILFLSSCSNPNTKPEEDPLKNTKRLVKDGHISLYQNGAINIPSTEIMLIPPGPDSVSFALELSGIKARASFLKSLQDAQNAVYLVADGTRKSFSLAESVIEKSDEVAKYITDYSRENSKLLIYRAYPDTQHIIGETYRFSDKTGNAIRNSASSLRKKSSDYGSRANTRHKSYENFADSSAEFAGKSIVNSVTDIGEDFKKIGHKFIKGYIALPEKWQKRKQRTAGEISPFKKSWKKSLNTRENLSEHFTEILSSTSNSYSTNISDSFAKSKNALSTASDTGVGLAIIDSTRWLLQALLWDATISPISKLGYASVGYVTSNAVLFPVMVVASESGAATKVAVEVAFNSGKKTVEIIAPTFEAALASTYAVSAFTIKSVGGVTLGSTGVALSTAIGATDSFSALTIQTVGNATGYGVEYIGVPLVTAGVAVGGTTTGVVVGSAKAITGSTLYIGGEVSSATTKTLGHAAAGSILVAGTSASVASGTGIGVYALSKAVAVPASYQLGSGIVLGYSSTSHIAAHTILAAADASYLVLSLEGPRWVVYAVKGNLGSGDNLIPGTVLNLNEMRTSGEKLETLPVSQENLNLVTRDIQKDILFESGDDF